jgi:hypothetical protein
MAQKEVAKLRQIVNQVIQAKEPYMNIFPIMVTELRVIQLNTNTSSW